MKPKDNGRGGIYYPELKQRLAALLKARGMTAPQLEERTRELGKTITERTIRDILKGRRQYVRESTLNAIAEALGVSLEDLCGPRGSKYSRLRAFLRTLLPVLLILALLIWAITALVNTSASDVVISRGNGGLVAHNARNEVVWRFDAKATVHFSDESPWHDDTWLVGLRGDASDGGSALLLDMSDGDTIWTVKPHQDRMRAVYGDTLLTSGAGFVALRHEAVDIDGDHEPELALIFNHDRFCPTCVILVERDGTRIGQYDHKGHFYDLLTEDIDADGKEELLVAGTNNEPCYQGATVILLDDVCHAGAAQDSLAGGDPAVPDSARVRLVLPQFGEPYMTLLERRRIEAADLMVVPQENGLPRIAVNVGTEYKDYKVGVIVTLDAALDPVSVTPSDAIVAIAATWPDSVRARNGFPNQEWLERVWLPRAVRFEAGHWPGSANGPANSGRAAATALPNPVPSL